MMRCISLPDREFRWWRRTALRPPSYLLWSLTAVLCVSAHCCAWAEDARTRGNSSFVRDAESYDNEWLLQEYATPQSIFRSGTGPVPEFLPAEDREPSGVDPWELPEETFDIPPGDRAPGFAGDWLDSASSAGTVHPAAAESWLAPDVPAASPDVPLVRSRNGCYQGSQVTFTWLPDSASPGVELRTLDTSATFAFPLGSFENLLLVTPYLRADDVAASAVVDIPRHLYDTGVKMLWKRPISDRWSSLFVVTPSVRSDFETSTDAFRLFGLGLLTWQGIPGTLAISGGAIWTGREDFPVLPAAGMLWTPTPDWKLDFQFPAPRVSRRVICDPGRCETWIYLSGQLGGNTWAVTRPSGPEDVLTISDQRLNAGVERLWAGNRSVFAEAGIVFNRSMEFLSTAIERELDSSVVLRAGVQF